jgi:hypothetical protein
LNFSARNQKQQKQSARGHENFKTAAVKEAAAENNNLKRSFCEHMQIQHQRHQRAHDN